MALIGNIVIGLTTSMGGLTKGLGQASGSLGAFGSKVKGLGSGGFSALGDSLGKITPLAQSAMTGVGGLVGTVGKLAAVAGVGLGVGALTAWVKGSIAAADDAGDFAAQLGTTAGSLQALRYAAHMAGSSADTLDGAMLKMGKSLGDAVRNGGPLVKTLDGLGLSAQDLATMDPSEAFTKIAGAISTVKNPAEQASIATEFFGRSATKMLALFSGGPGKLAELTAEAKRLGFALGDEQAAKLGEAQDAMDKLGFATQGLGNVLSVAVVPYLTSVTEGLVEFIAQVTNVEGIFGTFGSVVGDVVENISFAIRNAGSIWEIFQLQAQQAFGNIIAVIETFPENFGKIMAWLGRSWFDLLVDFANAERTVFSNLIENAVEFGKAIWSAIQGDGFEFKWKPLLDGFEATAEAFPELAKPAWISLEDQIAAVGEEIGRRETKRAEDLAKAVEAKSPAKAAAPLTEKGREDPKFADASVLGSQKAYEAVLRFSGRTAGKIDAQARLAKNAEEQVKLQGRIANALEKPRPGSSAEVYAFS